MKIKTSQELDERLRAEILDLLTRIVPEGGLKYANEELLKAQIDITTDNFKPIFKDYTESVAPEKGNTPDVLGGNSDWMNGYNQACVNAQKNSNRLLGEEKQ